MTDSTTSRMAGELLKTFVDKYRVELKRLNYARATINVYLSASS